ncbi:MAG TPA: zinc-binding dehydrogenase, partial [Acidimicrobiales bacterium]|nr:zinc-binding dehydrogenase [Acidimicrobiales bacterium]
MRACIIHDFEAGPKVEDVEVLDPQPGEVVVRLAASGVCGSDMHVIHGRSVVTTLPMVLGHEGAGVIEAVGAGVENVTPGDPVVIALYGPCLQCENCLTGNIVHCNGPARVANIFGKMADGSTRLRQGNQAVYPMVGCGSLAEYAVVRASMVVPVPQDVPLDVIALAGCGVTTGLGAAFNTAKVAPGDTVAVVGCGGVGLNVIQGARIAGAKTIIAVDTNTMKLDIASKVGATHCVDAASVEMKAAVSAIVPNGVDHAFEVVGNAELVAAVFELTRPGGQCVMVGSPPAGTKIPIDGRSLFAERRLLGTTGGSNVPHRDIPRIVDLYRSGRLDLDSLISQRLPLEDVHAAFAAADAGTVA